MSEPFIGEIRNFGFSFAPVGWAQCAGQLMSIAQNTALFSLLGTTYGGNGQTTFGLPDLRGRTPIGVGQGPGLSQRDLGEVAGQEQVTLSQQQLPAHNHTVGGASSAASKNPSNSVPGFTSGGSSYAATADLTMSPQMVGGGGSGQPHDNMQPYLVMNWCIATEGIYPSRP